MSKALDVLLELKDCSDYWSEYSVPIGIHERIDKAIQELLAQPEQELFFQKTYYADNLEDIMEDFYNKLNRLCCIIPLDENGFNEGVFEVTVNWREE